MGLITLLGHEKVVNEKLIPEMNAREYKNKILREILQKNSVIPLTSKTAFYQSTLLSDAVSLALHTLSSPYYLSEKGVLSFQNRNVKKKKTLFQARILLEKSNIWINRELLFISEGHRKLTAVPTIKSKLIKPTITRLKAWKCPMQGCP